jgi:hypothetical protein
MDKDFEKDVIRIANHIDESLEGESVLHCLAALTLVIGAALAEDVVGQIEEFEDIDAALDVMSKGIRAAYMDYRRTND